MSFLQAIALGVLQGITEFLPISSSGHLVLAETIFHLDVENLKDFDVVLHMGTLLAILIFFWRDLIQAKNWGWLILGTVPAVVIGFTLEDQIDALFRSATSVGVMMVLVGLLFFIPAKANTDKLTFGKVLLIGLAQACALIPGVSRSGATIWTGSMLGLSRAAAARFSFMLGAIAITGAGLLTAADFAAGSVEGSLAPTLLLTGFVASFLSGWASVAWLMKFLQKHSLAVFGVYRLILGTITIIVSLL